MKVRITQAAGYRDRHDVFHEQGDVCELPDHVAIKLIGYRIAAAVRETPVERAVKTPAEHTAKAAPKPKPKASRSKNTATEEAD